MDKINLAGCSKEFHVGRDCRRVEDEIATDAGDGAPKRGRSFGFGPWESTQRTSGRLMVILWMDEIRSHHFETMGNHGFSVFTRESSFQSFVGGFRPSTVGSFW